MSEIPPINGVAEIVLSVRDLPRMREFYQEVMGFELFSQSAHPREGSDPGLGASGDPEAPTIAFLTIKPLDSPLGRHGHPQLLALIDFQRHIFATRFVGHEPSRSTLNHLAFEIPSHSYDDHRRRLESLGLAPRPSSFPDMNARALFFEDPEGNMLELICHAPGGMAP